MTAQTASRAAGRRGPPPRMMGDSSEDDGWVVVRQGSADTFERKVSSATATSHSSSREELLELKKQVWQLRICKRRPAKTVAQELGEGLDEAQVELYAAEMEAVRDAMGGVHWTFFEEELMSGAHDARILGGSFDDAMAAASAGPACITSVAWPTLATRKKAGKSHKKPGTHVNDMDKKSPISSPLQTAKPSPHSSPAVGAKPFPAKFRSMPPPEVWLAAKEHRKSNFFGAAVFQDCAATHGCPRLLLAILANCEARQALSLAVSSHSFMAVLLKDKGEVANKLWTILGNVGFKGAVDSHASSTFASEMAFQPAVWARHRAFVNRCVRGLTKPAEVTRVTSVDSAGGFGSFLGSGDAKRLILGDGRQNFNSIDVALQAKEDATVDRFSKCTLRSSLGVHPVEVTASWPVGHSERLWCIAAGGVVCARPVPQRGVLPKESAPAFQWLELPVFDAASMASALMPAASPGLKPASSPVIKPSASPSLKPLSAPKRTSPAASPVLKAAPPPKTKSSPVQSASPDVSLARHQVPQDQVAHAGIDAPAVAVEVVWPLPGDCVLLLVREEGMIGTSKHGASGVGTPSSCSNHGSPELTLQPVSTKVSPLGSPLPSPQASPQTKVSTPPGNVPSMGRRWLQVWKLPSNSGGSATSAFEHIVSAPSSCAVTAMDTYSERDSSICWVLCGMEFGGSELRYLDTVAKTFTVEQSWPSVSAKGDCVSHTLLRSIQPANPLVIVGLTWSVQVHGSWGTTTAIPAQGFEQSAVVGIRPIGTRSFAVCTNTHVHAFEASAESPPSLIAVVALPALAEPPLHPEDPVVSHFSVTLYNCFVVLNKNYARSAKTNALCFLWPSTSGIEGLSDADLEIVKTGCAKARASPPPAALTLIGTDVLPEDAEEDEPDMGASKATYLRAWRRRPLSNDDLQPMRSIAIYLNLLLLQAQRCPPVQHLALDSDGGTLLALAAAGCGVTVCTWGVETSPKLAHVREQRRLLLKEEAEQQRLETCRLRLLRLEQKLVEIDKLENKQNEKGADSLSEEERAKLLRRSQVESDIEQLREELGMFTLDENESDDESEIERERALQAQQRHQEKKMCQKQQVETKKARQKDREKNREQKFSLS